MGLIPMGALVLEDDGNYEVCQPISTVSGVGRDVA
jgi:hypothetical protein